ncbi:MAG: ABC transporter ATP-binding protein [Syntrophobacterales bacterium]|nr:ABC transporter ATP-binding protein [Syntrophobacterales bacterium]
MENPLIEIRDLRFAYPDGTRALQGVTLEVGRGETIGLIGSNGAGKSTLLLHLNGILRGEGRVRILGMEATEKNLPELRRRVGMVFQDPENQLFMPTVYDDVGFGPLHLGRPKGEVDDAVRRALAAVDMLAFIERTPHHLSIGEKKRIAIATVLSMDPEILVLDEPSSNLDPRHRRELMTLLERLSITKIIASHDLDFISRTCSRVALLDAGVILASGGTAAILGDRALMGRFGMLDPPATT